MPEAALPRLDPLQRERLAALGVELLTLRSAPQALGSCAPQPLPAASDDRAAPVSRLVVLGADAAWNGGDDAALLQSMLAALSLRREEIVTTHVDALPVLAFGEAGPAGAIAVPALRALRTAAAKRDLWPTLRRLRRRLQGRNAER